jgi:ABC-2 type transport system ATP-binding protein
MATAFEQPIANGLLPDPMGALECIRLRKSYGRKIAVRGLSLRVARGEVFGFLGPNGAGKSTVVKMLVGLVHPTGGAATVLGRPLSETAIRARIGFLPEQFRFYDWLTGPELLELHGRLYGLAGDDLRRRAGELLERVGLQPHRDKALRHYSKGMLQRIGLAQALLNRPELIFLDEPTSGLDPLGRRLVRDIIHEQRAAGVTVFLNSHLLSEIELTCDRVAFVKAGAVVHVRELSSADRELEVEVRASNVTEICIAGLQALASHVERRPGGLGFRVPREEALPAIVRHLVAAGAGVYSVSPSRISLEELFVSIIGQDEGL